MTQRLTFAVVATCLGVLVASAAAGPLATHPDAFDDGSKVWAGSTLFDSATGVSGRVDWAVFAPGLFPYAGSGYTPTPGEYVYAYQFHNDGTDALTSLSVALLHPADNVGTFTALPGDASTGAVLLPASKAEWGFSGLAPGDSTVGLAFSAPTKPQDLFGIVLGGGTFALAQPLPSPSSTDVPEPVTLGLLAAGSVLALTKRR